MLLIDREDGSPLQVWIHSEWRLLADVQDQAFISDLMEEWMAVEPDKIPYLFNELKRQSREPISVCGKGRVSSMERQAMIESILSANIPREG